MEFSCIFTYYNEFYFLTNVKIRGNVYGIRLVNNRLVNKQYHIRVNEFEMCSDSSAGQRS